MIILVEDSLGWQNMLIDKASVQFRLTTSRDSAMGLFLYAEKEVNMGGRGGTFDISNEKPVSKLMSKVYFNGAKKMMP